MSAHVPIRDLFGLLLPLGCKSGVLAMLRAYFDDSGTHDGSKVVVVAGIMGTESELESLDALWGDALNRPLCGLRPAVSEFHARDCDQSDGEFAGWKRGETDYFRHQLREIIIKSHVSAYGIAYSRADWDEIITDDIRDVFGNAEGNAVRNCFVRVLRWADRNAFDPDISFIFDDSDKLERKRDIMSVYDAFKQQATIKNVVGIAFMDSKKIRPLQVADLLAWEFNRYAHEILESGLDTPAPAETLHLAKNMSWLDGQIAQRERIIQIRDFAKEKHSPEDLAAFANYFRTFGAEEFASAKEKRKAARGKREKPRS